MGEGPVQKGPYKETHRSTPPLTYKKTGSQREYRKYHLAIFIVSCFSPFLKCGNITMTYMG